MAFPTISVKNNFLIFETFFLLQKVSFDSIEDILISHVQVQTKHKISIYLNQPLINELKSETFVNKLLFFVFRAFNKNPYEIIAQYENTELAALLRIFKENLDHTTIPDDLDKSILWRTVDQGLRIPGTKLIYSKNKLGLAEVLKKHHLLAER
ncbi:hypothetical protein [Chryseobacterium populi]|uniref:Uncharacterized protein n=1 Tax=Chryseobacterium populi TaxID=1144316 RepID=J3CMT6_9FLAO|nr:hypothetical protein [Chryseobacterium populi]EJL74651.1 hypothetical protein PMI13_00893 [Chryseobacterium populi]